MNAALSESGIVKAVAEHAAHRTTRRAIADLQRMEHTLFGDDSPLRTTWDEICVQEQTERSFAWNTYDETVRVILGALVDELPQHERSALWLQTDAGSDWEGESADERPVNPVSVGDIIDYLAVQHLYPVAERWTNARIRAYVDRRASSD